MRDRSLLTAMEAVTFLLASWGTTRVGRPEEIGCDDGLSWLRAKADYMPGFDHRYRRRRNPLALTGGIIRAGGTFTSKDRRRSQRGCRLFAVNRRTRLARHVMREALRSFFNIVGCAIGGAVTRGSTIADGRPAAFAGAGRATLLGRGRKCRRFARVH